MLASAFVGALVLALTQRLWINQQLPGMRPLIFLGAGAWTFNAVMFGSGLCLVLAFSLRTLAEARLREDVYGQGASQRLVRTGPFAWLRNPLYLGTWLFFFGAVALWAPLLLWLVLSAVFFLVLDAMVRHEEGLLSRQFGADYDAYLSAVRRWLPGPPGGDDPPEPISARAFGWAALGNLGIASLGLFRVAVAVGAPAGPAGLINLGCIAIWLTVVAKRRLAGSKR